MNKNRIFKKQNKTKKHCDIEVSHLPAQLNILHSLHSYLHRIEEGTSAVFTRVCSTGTVTGVVPDVSGCSSSAVQVN